jgi:2-dehydro-3-deoxygluconokinase
MKCDLMTFGEAMIRLTPPDHMRLEQTDRLDMTVGGAEWNVAVNVSRLGLKTAWVSRLVDNWSGRLMTQQAGRHGVDTSAVKWVDFDGVGQTRNGFYHLEVGVGPRASAVTYDRGHTAISQTTPEMFDWASLLDGCGWLHCSGITPALSPSLAETVVAMFQAASDCGVTTSYDLNFRGKLWTSEQARQANQRIVPHVKVLIGNEEDFEKCLGLKAEGTDEDFSSLDPSSYKQVVEEACRQFPNLQLVGTTLRDAKTGLLNDWRTLVYDGEAFHLSRIYENLEIVDRVGGGDSFASGLIYSLTSGKTPKDACEFAAGFSALAHTFPGDMNWANHSEVAKVIAGGSARISR